MFTSMVPGDGPLSEPLLALGPLPGVGGREHLAILLQQRRFGQHLEVPGNLATGLERRGLERGDPALNQPVQQIEIRRDATSPRIGVGGSNRFVRLPDLLAVELPHLLDEMIVHQGKHRRDAVLRNPQRGIDHETRAHYRNVKSMSAGIRPICHESPTRLKAATGGNGRRPSTARAARSPRGREQNQARIVPV